MRAAYVAHLMCAAMLGIAASPIALQAQAPDTPRAVQPERPTVATHAGAVAPGYLEIESGIEHDRFSPGNAVSFEPTVFKFGLASHAQLSVTTSYVHGDAGPGFGDLGVGIKWRLVDDAPVIGDFAILPALKFPTGSFAKGTGTGTTDAGLLLISSHALGPVSMDLNAGVVRRLDNPSALPKSATVWTASFGGPFDDLLGWVVECYGYPGTGGPAGTRPIVALLGGPTLKVRDWLVFDAGAIVPVAGPQPHSWYAGGVYNVGRIW